MEMSTEYAGDNASPYIHAVLDDIIQANAADAPDIVNGEDSGAEDGTATGTGTGTDGDVELTDTQSETPGAVLAPDVTEETELNSATAVAELSPEPEAPEATTPSADK